MAKFTSYKKDVQRTMEQKQNALLEALGMEYTANAKTEMDILIYNAPLPPSAGPGYGRTGALREAQGYEVDRQDKLARLGNSMHYAPHVHWPGLTRNFEGRPFMTNALNNYQQDYQNVANAVMSD